METTMRNLREPQEDTQSTTPDIDSLRELRELQIKLAEEKRLAAEEIKQRTGREQLKSPVAAVTGLAALAALVSGKPEIAGDLFVGGVSGAQKALSLENSKRDLQKKGLLGEAATAEQMVMETATTLADYEEKRLEAERQYYLTMAGGDPEKALMYMEATGVDVFNFPNGVEVALKKVREASRDTESRAILQDGLKIALAAGDAEKAAGFMQALGMEGVSTEMIESYGQLKEREQKLEFITNNWTMLTQDFTGASTQKMYLKLWEDPNDFGAAIALGDPITDPLEEDIVEVRKTRDAMILAVQAFSEMSDEEKLLMSESPEEWLSEVVGAEKYVLLKDTGKDQTVLAGLINNSLVINRLKYDRLAAEARNTQPDISEKELDAFIYRRLVEDKFSGDRWAQVVSLEKASGKINTDLQELAKEYPGKVNIPALAAMLNTRLSVEMPGTDEEVAILIDETISAIRMQIENKEDGAWAKLLSKLGDATGPLQKAYDEVFMRNTDKE